MKKLDIKQKNDFYEASPNDLAFIRKSILPTIALQNENNFELIVNEFERLIAHFEFLEYKDYLVPPKSKKNKFNAPSNIVIKHKLPNVDLFLSDLNVLDKSHQELVIQFWKEEQKRVKRPLVRKYWTILFNNNQGFGVQSLNKMAFAPRTVSKRQLRKCNRFFGETSLANKLVEFYEENKKALFIVKMIKQRETLKFHQNLLKYNKNESGKYLKRIIDNHAQAHECMKMIDAEFEKNNMVVDVDTDKNDFERDTLEFFCNLMSQTLDMGININHINTPHQHHLENKVTELKKSIQQNSLAKNQNLEEKSNHIIITEDVLLENPKNSLLQYVNFNCLDLRSPFVLLREGRHKDYFIEWSHPRKNNENIFDFQNFVKIADPLHSPNHSFMDHLNGYSGNGTRNDYSVHGLSYQEDEKQDELVGKRDFENFEDAFLKNRFKNEISICVEEPVLFEQYSLLDDKFFDKFHKKIKNK